MNVLNDDELNRLEQNFKKPVNYVFLDICSFCMGFSIYSTSVVCASLSNSERGVESQFKGARKMILNDLKKIIDEVKKTNKKGTQEDYIQYAERRDSVTDGIKELVSKDNRLIKFYNFWESIKPVMDAIIKFATTDDTN